MRRRFVSEVVSVMQNVKKLLLISLSFTLFGVLVWCTTDGIGLFWKMSIKPPLACPLVVLLLLWTVAYFLYGVILAQNFCGNLTDLALKLTLSYLISLFWCPLALSAGSKVTAVVSLGVSLLYLGIFIKKRRCFALLTVISALFILFVQLYSAYITVGLC